MKISEETIKNHFLNNDFQTTDDTDFNRFRCRNVNINRLKSVKSASSVVQLSL
jgi:hypothetical protein